MKYHSKHGRALPPFFEVYINKEKVKEYPTRLQAVIYLMMHGYCYRGRGFCFLSDKVEIREVKNVQ